MSRFKIHFTNSSATNDNETMQKLQFSRKIFSMRFSNGFLVTSKFVNDLKLISGDVRKLSFEHIYFQNMQVYFEFLKCFTSLKSLLIGDPGESLRPERLIWPELVDSSDSRGCRAARREIVEIKLESIQLCCSEDSSLFESKFLSSKLFQSEDIFLKLYTLGRSGKSRHSLEVAASLSQFICQQKNLKSLSIDSYSFACEVIDLKLFHVLTNLNSQKQLTKLEKLSLNFKIINLDDANLDYVDKANMKVISSFLMQIKDTLKSLEICSCECRVWDTLKTIIEELQLENLKISGYEPRRKPIEFPKSKKKNLHLKSLDITFFCCFQDVMDFPSCVEVLVMESFPSIENLIIYDGTNEILNLIAEHLKSIKFLEAYWIPEDAKVHIPSLQSFIFNDRKIESLTNFLQSNPQLESISFVYYDLNYDCLNAMTTILPNLQKLQLITNYLTVDLNILQMLVTNCPKLKLFYYFIWRGRQLDFNLTHFGNLIVKNRNYDDLYYVNEGSM
jgi:hypothetical protein